MLTDQEVIDMLVTALTRTIPALDAGRAVAEQESRYRTVDQCEGAIAEAERAIEAARTRILR